MRRRVGPRFGCRSIPFSFSRYFYKRYGITSGYLHRRITLQVPRDECSIPIVGPGGISPSNRGYQCFGTSQVTICKLKVDHVFSSLGCQGTVTIEERMCCCFKQDVFCQVLRGRHRIAPSRRRRVQRVFIGGKVSARPICSRCRRRCD